MELWFAAFSFILIFISKIVRKAAVKAGDAPGFTAACAGAMGMWMRLWRRKKLV